MAKRRKPHGMDRTLGRLIPFAKPGAVMHVQVEHDDACRAWRTGRLADCSCSPNLLVRPPDAPKGGK
jgi:hypothetical protein